MGNPAFSKTGWLETTEWIGQILGSINRDYSVIVMGDFNAEPHESPFGDLGLKGKRTFSIIHRSSASSNLYNTAWRFLSEKDSWEVAGQPGYVQLRPTTSHGDRGNNSFDHLFVSRRALKGGLCLVKEESVGYYCDQRTSWRNKYGFLHPRKWNYVSQGEHEGVSDHSPLLATFVISNN